MSYPTEIDDCLMHYVTADPLSVTYGFSLDDVRGGIVETFAYALRKNAVQPDATLVLVFNCAGSAITEREMVKKASAMGYGAMHVVLCDVVYENARARPDPSTFGVPSSHVHFVNHMPDLPGFMATRFGDTRTCKIMYNSVFHTISASPPRNFDRKNPTGLRRYMETYTQLCLDVSVHMFNLCMPYGIHFDMNEFASRKDATEYMMHYPNAIYRTVSHGTVQPRIAQLEQLRRAILA